MSITVGEALPAASLLVLGKNGPEAVSLGDKLKGRKVVIFGLVGAYTTPCTMDHVPSFIRAKDKLAEKGVDEIICIAVNDPFVMKAWGDSTGAAEAGISMLADSESTYTKAIGMDFTAPAAGLIDRSLRYAMLVEDGVVKVLNKEENSSICDLSSGEAMLASM